VSRQQEALDEFKRRLDAFVTSGQHLVVSWEEMERATGHRFVDRVNRHYPFDKDFYELLLDMALWAGEVRKIEAEGVLDWRPD
jgi:hypothetical protein